MKRSALNNDKIERLDAIARLGGKRIAASLSKWISTVVTAKSSSTSIVPYTQLLNPAFLQDEVITTILIKVSGGIDGYLLFLFDEESTKGILSRILRRNTGPFMEWDDITRSAMEETGNIIGTAFLNEIAMGFNLEIYPASPVVACDFAGAIVETIMAQFAMKGDYALSCQITFRSNNDEINGTFCLLPDDTGILEHI